jgi:hypothetical protein
MTSPEIDVSVTIGLTQSNKSASNEFATALAVAPIKSRSPPELRYPTRRERSACGA